MTDVQITSQPSRHWVIATNSAKKWVEFQGLFQGLFDQSTPAVKLTTLADHAIASPAETGLTFVENALIKARVATAATGLPSIADDSGLVVPAFGGAPGLYSARYAFAGATDADNNQALLETLHKAGLTTTPAYYHCTLVFLRHAEDPDPIIAQGYWHGQIKARLVGDKGFGYDPMFFPGPDYNRSAAELPQTAKAKLSHRGIALYRLASALAQGY